MAEIGSGDGITHQIGNPAGVVGNNDNVPNSSPEQTPSPYGGRGRGGRGKPTQSQATGNGETRPGLTASPTATVDGSSPGRQLRRPKPETEAKFSSPLNQSPQASQNDKMNEAGGLNPTAKVFVPTFSAADSTLNVSAAEFVPRSFTVDTSYPPSNNDQVPSQYNRLMTSVPDFLIAPSEGPNGDAIDCVKDAVLNLTVAPGNLVDYMAPLLDDLNSTVDSKDSVREILDVIFEQAITEQNFTYTAARMCEYLVIHLKPLQDVGPFRHILLEKLQVAHDIALNKTDDCKRINGYAQFLGELFMTQSCRFGVLGIAIMEIVKKIFSDPTIVNVKAGVNVLKLTGGAMDDLSLLDEGFMGQVTDFFEYLRQQTTNTDFTERGRDHIKNVLHLRTLNWGRSDSPVPVTNNIYSHGFEPYVQSEPIFYNSTGCQITREQAGYNIDPGYPDYCTDDDIYYDDEMESDEVQNAYELFLRETEAKRLY